MEQNIINNIKSLGLDMINEAKSGHPGIVLGASPIIYTLFNNHLIINPSDDKWLNRDRFVLSAGHGSALLYATLYMAGYNIPLEEIKRFRQVNSITPGHPEVNITPGVEATTGPLGQGIANAVGMAIAQKMLNKTNSIIDYKVYVLCSDGDLMEGISYESCSLAGTLNLNNLIILYDSNDICLDGKVDHSFKEDVVERFKAMGFYTDFVLDGNDVTAIDNAINKAKRSGLPSMIEIKTIIGEGSIHENTNIVHGKPLDIEDITQIKKELNISNIPFYVNEEAKALFNKNIIERSLNKYNTFKEEYAESINIDLDFNFNFDEQDEMRNLNGKVMNEIAKQDRLFISGSADLFSSTKTYINDSDMFNGNNYSQNIAFGVREHSMAGISNGLALSGFKPVISTFLTFADYLKPSLRLSSLMHLPVTYVFTHDSITIGSDGPTHQPIEQLAMLRATPNINVFRPADINELIGSWKYILKNDKPNVLVVTKEKVNKLTTTNIDSVSLGAYIIKHQKTKLHGTIIATGYEVHTAIKLSEMLYEKEQLDLRVVSMPCMELFLLQSREYQEEIIPKGYRNIVIEAASSYGWHRFVYNDNYLMTVDSFGASGTKDDILKHMNYDIDSLYLKIKKLYK
jgi:transketolase